MKQFLSLVLALVLILALAGCGAGTAAPTQPETTPAVSQPDTDVGDPADIEPTFMIDRNGGFPYQTETMELDSDGGKIHTVLYIPESGAEIFPAVIFSHGFGDTGRGGADKPTLRHWPVKAIWQSALISVAAAQPAKATEVRWT